MKKAHEERNIRIRRIYDRRIKELKMQGEKKFMDIAIEELKHQFNAWELDYDTIRQIVHRKDYGNQWFHIQVLNGKLWEALLEDGEPVKSQSIGQVKKDLKRLGALHPDAKLRIKKLKAPPAPVPEGAEAGPVGALPPEESAAPVDQKPGSEPEMGEKGIMGAFSRPMLENFASR